MSKRGTLVVAVLGSSMAFLDGTVVNVALPVMQQELSASVAVAQWIVEAYALFLAALVLVGGALGDQLGRKRTFLGGVVLFAAASAGCGIAPTSAALVAMRAVQGVGAALLVPGSLALISAANENETERGAAIGTWSAFSAITAAIGPVAGGWVVAHGSWRWLFFFNVPVAAIVIAIAVRGVAESRDETAHGVDWLGALLAAIGLGFVVYALIESERDGWTATNVVLEVLGVATLALFVFVESRLRSPMVPLALFRSPVFSGTNALTFLLYGALGGGLFFVPFDLIQVQHYSPTAAGASLLPFILIISAMSRPMGKLSQRIGARRLLCVGPIIAGAGFALLAMPRIGGNYFLTFFPGIVVLGIGMGITVAPLTSAVMGSVDSHHAGVASGINNAVSRAASLIAVAAFGALLLVQFNRVLDGELATIPADLRQIVEPERSKLGAADFSHALPSVRATLEQMVANAFVSAFRVVMLVCAALGVAGGIFGWWLVRDSPLSSSKQ